MIQSWVFALALLIPWVLGHGRLTKPQPRDALAGAPIYKQNEPVPYSSAMACKGYRPQTPRVTLTAGQPLTVQWNYEEANHVGDCFFYLSYDTELPESQQRWFKIAQIAECNLKDKKDVAVMIPSWVRSCSHCVLRYERYALHLVSSIEFYVHCVDVQINGGANGVLGQPLVTVPNHLPRSNPPGSRNYRLAFNRGSPFFFTGPALAAPDHGNDPAPAPAPAPRPVPAPAPRPVPAPQPRPNPLPPGNNCARPRDDGRCGPSVDNAPCPAGQCCSQFGWCGTGSEYCGSNSFVALPYDPYTYSSYSPPRVAMISSLVTAALMSIVFAIALAAYTRRDRIPLLTFNSTSSQPI